MAFELAKAIGAEIVSVDSMKVYRRMDIGTAKPAVEKRSQMTYHLVDVVEPSEAFSVDAGGRCWRYGHVYQGPAVWIV